MKTTRFCRRTCVTLWLLACAANATAQDDEQAAFFRDPLFKRAVLASYGVRTDMEPSLDAEERLHMEKIIELLGSPQGFYKARVYMRDIVRDPNGNPVFDFTLANIYFQQDMPHVAAKYYRRAIGKFESYQRAHKNLGLIEVHLGEFEQALRPLRRAIELGPADGLSYGLLGYAYSMTGQFVSAELPYRMAVTLQPELMDWKLGLAKCLFKQLKHEEAASLCDELIRRDGENVDFWLLQANAYLGMRQPLLAAQNYEYLAAMGKAPPESLNVLGDIYVNEGNMDLAADAYVRALEGEAKPDADRYLRNAEVLVARAAFEGSATVLHQLRERLGTEMTPSQQKRALKLEARMAAAQGAANEQQVALLQSIVELDPLDGEAHILLAQHHERNDDLERAIFLFEAARNIEGFEGEACLRHGQALVRAGRYGEALALLKRALQLQPGDALEDYVKQVERVALGRR